LHCDLREVLSCVTRRASAGHEYLKLLISPIVLTPDTGAPHGLRAEFEARMEASVPNGGDHGGRAANDVAKVVY